LPPRIARLASETEKCMRCGFCQGVCPVYRETRGESAVARGRLALLEAALAGRVRWGQPLEERLSTCLLCGACLAGCPSGVRVDRAILDARAHVVEIMGLPMGRRMLLRRLIGEGRLDACAKFARRFQRLALRRRGENLHSPSFLLNRGRLLPALAGRTLYEEVRERAEDGRPLLARGDGRGTVTFFPGCLITYVYPQVGLAAGRVLGALGYEVRLPAAPACCGAPAVSVGDLNTAACAVARARDGLGHGTGSAATETIVTACASCAATLGEGEEGRTVVDVARFLMEDGNADRLQALGAFGKWEAGPVTYHDPCHHRHAAGLGQPPRELLRRLAGPKFVEMSEPACCGLGGAFSLRHYDLTRRIGRRQATLISRTEARLVATSCPGCVLQTNENLAVFGRHGQVVHVLELLDRSLEGRV
jgi:glycolate oxidase iron-sulfur subunit